MTIRIGDLGGVLVNLLVHHVTTARGSYASCPVVTFRGFTLC
jgi:hypothetical protein